MYKLLKLLVFWRKAKKNGVFIKVDESEKVEEITIRPIPLEKYTEVVNFAVDLADTISKHYAETKGQRFNLEKYLAGLTISQLMMEIPILLRIATDKTLSFLAIVTGCEEDKIRKLNIGQAAQLAQKIFEINQAVEVPEVINFFRKHLKKK